MATLTATRVRGGKLESGCFASITMTRGDPERAEETLTVVAEVIEALSGDSGSLLARETRVSPDLINLDGPRYRGLALLRMSENEN